MVAHVSTIALQGIAATTVDVQVQVRSGLASFQVVGLPDGAVRESRERVQAALHSLGLALPAKRIVVNLSPADLAKEGNHYDLPIAVGLMAALELIPADAADLSLYLGELGLDGSVRPVHGGLAAALHAAGAGLSSVVLPAANAPEAAWAGSLNVFGVAHLRELLAHLRGNQKLVPATPKVVPPSGGPRLDFRDVKGQETAKRAAEIAAAGGHNLLMCGPPGAGKSMIAHRLPGLLPPLSAEEALEVSLIHSVAGLLPDGGLVTERPFRDPHHSASAVALCGGSHSARPGEMSLAHRGVLFLDELPEFPRAVLETLRQPLETGSITVSRAQAQIRYPARFQLVAAMNPSPCGYLGHPTIPCTSTPRQIQAYRARLSGPLLDRIDLHLDVPVVPLKDLSLPPARESTADMAARVARARALQRARYAGLSVMTNAEADGALLEEVAAPTPEGRYLLDTAGTRYALSARGYHRVLKVARTIADLAGEAQVAKPHIAEALSFRPIPVETP